MNDILTKEGVVKASLPSLIENNGKGTIIDIKGYEREVVFDKIFTWMRYPIMNHLNIDNSGFVYAKDVDEAAALVFEHVTPINGFGELDVLCFIEYDFAARCDMVYANVNCPENVAEKIYARWKEEEDLRSVKSYIWMYEHKDGEYSCHTRCGFAKAVSEKDVLTLISREMPDINASEDNVKIKRINSEEEFGCIIGRDVPPRKVFEWTVDNPPMSNEFNLANGIARIERGQESGIALANSAKEVKDMIKEKYPNIDKRSIVSVSELDMNECFHLIGCYTE